MHHLQDKVPIHRCPVDILKLNSWTWRAIDPTDMSTDKASYSNSRSKVCVKYAGPMELWNDALVTPCEGQSRRRLGPLRLSANTAMLRTACFLCVIGHRELLYYHQMLGAAIIHPDVREVIPLMPEPIVKQDGTDKNDCERNAAKRFVAKLRQDHPHLKFIVTEDGLSSNAPHIETLHDHDPHYILGVKEGDHAFLFTQVQAAEHAGRVTHYERHDRAAGLVHRFRFVNDVPLNASNTDVRVNFIEYWEIGADKVQHFSWVTDLRVSRRNVFHLKIGR